jgi:pseudouridine-5'-phosphate glycosidase
MPVQVHPEVDRALRERQPVVALETAVATAGLPATALGRAPACDAPGWDPDEPCGLEVVRLQQRLVRAEGAVPATIGVIDGVFRIGMDELQLARLLEAGVTRKASARDLAAVMAQRGTAGTTVAGTLVGCRQPEIPIRVLATGGIGGLHRRWTEHLDVSADLAALATSRVCVVASGVKSVLDVTATLEAMEALGVPVVAFGTDLMPLFYCRAREEIPAPRRVDEVADIADICRAHWHELGCSTGVLAANPVADRHALDPAEVDRIVAEADPTALPGTPQAQRTPLLLAAVHAGTGGRALDANVSLLADNARLAAQVAAELK